MRKKYVELPYEVWLESDELVDVCELRQGLRILTTSGFRNDPLKNGEGFRWLTHRIFSWSTLFQQWISVDLYLSYGTEEQFLALPSRKAYFDEMLEV